MHKPTGCFPPTETRPSTSKAFPSSARNWVSLLSHTHTPGEGSPCAASEQEAAAATDKQQFLEVADLTDDILPPHPHPPMVTALSWGGGEGGG